MAREKDFFDQLDEERMATDPEYAKHRRRTKLVSELLELRHRLKLSQEAVAAKMGVKRAQVGALEADPGSVSMDMIAAYAEALGAEIVVRVPEVAA